MHSFSPLNPRGFLSPPDMRAPTKNITELERLLVEGNDPNEFNFEEGCAPLHLASSLEMDEGLDFISQLLGRGAQVNLVTNSMESPLLLTCKYESWKSALLLLSHGADTNISDKDSVSPLHLAAENGSAEIVEKLIKAGASIEAMDNLGRTPLFNAVEACNLETIESLIKAGASPLVIDKNGNSPLKACCSENIDVFNTLIQSKHVLNGLQTDKKLLNSLFQEALWSNNEGILDKLLALGADVNCPDEHGVFPIHSALEHSSKSIILKILQQTNVEELESKFWESIQVDSWCSLATIAVERDDEDILDAIGMKGFSSTILGCPAPLRCGHDSTRICLGGPIARRALVKGKLPFHINLIPKLVEIGVPLDPDLSQFVGEKYGCIRAIIDCHTKHDEELDCCCFNTLQFLLDSGGDPDYVCYPEKLRPLPQTYILAALKGHDEMLLLLVKYSNHFEVDDILFQLTFLMTTQYLNISNFSWLQLLARYCTNLEKVLQYLSSDPISRYRNLWRIAFKLQRVPQLVEISRAAIRKEMHKLCDANKIPFKPALKSLPVPRTMTHFLLLDDFQPAF